MCCTDILAVPLTLLHPMLAGLSGPELPDTAAGRQAFLSSKGGR
jgi:hypothetical protein